MYINADGLDCIFATGLEEFLDYLIQQNSYISNLRMQWVAMVWELENQILIPLGNI